MEFENHNFDIYGLVDVDSYEERFGEKTVSKKGLLGHWKKFRGVNYSDHQIKELKDVWKKLL